MMNCASFENRLTELLDVETVVTSREVTLAELRHHVDECPECKGAVELIELAALPPTERDPVDIPPESYWEGFNASIGRRLSNTTAVRSGGAWRRYAAAAAVTVALSGGWFLRGWLDPGPGLQQPAVAAGEQPGTADWSRLDEVIRQATSEELAAALRGLPGLGASGWAMGADWVPDAVELDEIDRMELMDWLDQLETSERRPTS